MIEKCLIEHCAPTLASLKAANLFNACCEEGENIDLQISRWNQLMNPKGCLLYTSPSPRDGLLSRMPSSA